MLEPEIITTWAFADRFDTLAKVRAAGINVCAGGVGMSEEKSDRIEMLVILANLPVPAKNVSVNMLVPAIGTPLQDAKRFGLLDSVRTVALARILMPKSVVLLAAGRAEMSDETQAPCFLAGANSVFIGDTLLTADNASEDRDTALIFVLTAHERQAGASH